jgi:hypothetical protein
MMLLVGKIWQIVSGLPNKNERSWEGNLLTFLTVKCLMHVKLAGTKGSPFKRNLGVRTLLSKHFNDNAHISSQNSRVFRMNHLREYIQGIALRDPIIQLGENQFPWLIHTSTKVIVITRDYGSSDVTNTWQVVEAIKNAGRSWKLCYIAQTTNGENLINANQWDGKVFCRHSNKEFSQWWQVTPSNSSSHRNLPASPRNPSI